MQAKKLVLLNNEIITNKPLGFLVLPKVNYSTSFLFGFISLFMHIIFFGGTAKVIQYFDNTPKNVQIVKLTTFNPPPPPIQEAPIDEKKIPPKPPKKPKIREDKRVIPQTKPVEIRGGLSNSTNLNSGATIGIAEGNTAEMAVNPKAANNPPPPPVAENTEDESVIESIADSPAQCPPPPQLNLSDDAINAGITSGIIVVDVIVSNTGEISGAILKKGIGYAIDSEVISAAKKIKCKPGIVNGKAVAIKNKQIIWNIIAN